MIKMKFKKLEPSDVRDYIIKDPYMLEKYKRYLLRPKGLKSLMADETRSV